MHQICEPHFSVCEYIMFCRDSINMSCYDYWDGDLRFHYTGNRNKNSTVKKSVKIRFITSYSNIAQMFNIFKSYRRLKKLSLIFVTHWLQWKQCHLKATVLPFSALLLLLSVVFCALDFHNVHIKNKGTKGMIK